MTFYPLLKLKYPFQIVQIGGQTQAVPTKEGSVGFHGIIRLGNDPAIFMFQKLMEGITLPDLMMACVKRYDGSTVEEIGPKVMAFLEGLGKSGLIVADPSRGVRDDRDLNNGQGNG